LASAKHHGSFHRKTIRCREKECIVSEKNIRIKSLINKKEHKDPKENTAADRNILIVLK
jgi:hypothetical protein